MGVFETKPPTPPLSAANLRRPYLLCLLATLPAAPTQRSLEQKSSGVHLLLLFCQEVFGSLQEAAGEGQRGTGDSWSGEARVHSPDTAVQGKQGKQASRSKSKRAVEETHSPDIPKLGHSHNRASDPLRLLFSAAGAASPLGEKHPSESCNEDQPPHPCPPHTHAHHAHTRSHAHTQTPAGT